MLVVILLFHYRIARPLSGVPTLSPFEAFRDGRCFVCNDLGLDRDGLGGIIAVPLKHRAKFLGVIRKLLQACVDEQIRRIDAPLITGVRVGLDEDPDFATKPHVLGRVARLMSKRLPTFVIGAKIAVIECRKSLGTQFLGYGWQHLASHPLDKILIGGWIVWDVVG